MIALVIQISDVRDASLVCRPFAAKVQADGYHIEARCAGWGRNRDGSVSVDITASLRSPPGLMGVLR